MEAKTSKAELAAIKMIQQKTGTTSLSEELTVRSIWKKAMFAEHVNSSYFQFDYPRTDVMIREILETCEN